MRHTVKYLSEAWLVEDCLTKVYGDLALRSQAKSRSRFLNQLSVCARRSCQAIAEQISGAAHNPSQGDNLCAVVEIVDKCFHRPFPTDSDRRLLAGTVRILMVQVDLYSRVRLEAWREQDRECEALATALMIQKKQLLLDSRRLRCGELLN